MVVSAANDHTFDLVLSGKAEALLIKKLLMSIQAITLLSTITQSHQYAESLRKHAYIVWTLLNPTFICSKTGVYVNFHVFLFKNIEYGYSFRDHFLARFRDILAFFCKKSHQNSRSEKKNRTLNFSHFAPLSSYFAHAVHFETIGLFCLTGF